MFSILLHFYKAAYEERTIPHAIGLFDFLPFPGTLVSGKYTFLKMWWSS